MQNILTAFLFTLIAGLSTGIGSVIAFVAKKTNTRFLAVSLGFSGGVMIYISMIEIFPKAVEELAAVTDMKTGTILTVVGFFIGIFLIALIDKLIPSEENPHEVKSIGDMNEEALHQQEEEKKKTSLMRTGIFTALAIGIHNFPEGLATFMAALKDPQLAVPIVIAIAIHNIPEGISVSVPIYYATGSRRKAFVYSFLSGLSEPLGALIGYLILLPFLSPVMQGMIFAATAGIMVFISIDELLPSAREYGEHHLSIYGFIGGMMLMAVSLIMFM